MNVPDAITIQAFSLARLQLASVLTDDLDEEIREVGDRVAQHDPSVAADVRKIVSQHTCLKDYYEAAYHDLERHYQHQERANRAPAMTAAVPPNHWERVVAEILRADAPLRTVRHLMRQLGAHPHAFATGIIDAFFTVLQKVLVDLDTHAIAILKALAERPLTLRDLVHLQDGSDDPHVAAMVHMLWREGYISRLNDSIVERICPLFSRRQRQDELDPDAYLTLSAKGHFMLRPIITIGRQSATVK